MGNNNYSRAGNVFLRKIAEVSGFIETIFKALEITCNLCSMYSTLRQMYEFQRFHTCPFWLKLVVTYTYAIYGSL